MRRTPEQLDELRTQAVALRRAGVGGKRIAKQLGIGGALACELLRGEPLPGSLLRPRAKDDLREAAIDLRQLGRTYDEIRDELAVSKSSLSLWLRDLPHPTPEQRAAAPAGGVVQVIEAGNATVARQLREQGWLLREIAVALDVAPKTVCLWVRGVPVPARAMHGKSPDEMRAMGRAYWDAKLAEREVERESIKSGAAAWVGALSDRELELIAVTAYWCEGAKDKPYARREQVKFINSDPGVVLLFLEFLRRQGFGWASLYIAVAIHETADISEAERWWADLIGADVLMFAKATIKRHKPLTNRKNIGVSYVGCLYISVRGSRGLYQHIEGVWRGISTGVNFGSATQPCARLFL